MQLSRKQRRRLRRTLLASSCALLGTAQSASADTGDWSFDAGLLFYSEVDRVQAIEPAAIITRDFGDDKAWSTRLVTDTLSGATPTGAMPSSKSSTTTGPSGKSQSSNPPGATPMDGNFRDLRRAISSTWSQPFADVWHVDAGLSYSIEHDFKSEGVNTLFSRDFNERNTTLSAGAAYEWDEIFPVGGIHAPLSTVSQGAVPGGIDLNPPIAASETKHELDALLGLTQVMNRDWLLELNYSYARSEGYQNDPYKVVSIINTHLGGLFPIGFGPPLGEPLSNIFENRPELRQKRALYLGNKVYVNGDVLDFSYRYGWDDWGIKSNAYELRYRFAFGDDDYLQPHLRYYHQTAADFYHRGLLDTDTVPQFVSADYRLAEFTARTVGLEYGTRIAGKYKVSLRVERYIQSGGSDPHVEVGEQTGYELFPELKADIVQVSLDF